MAEVQPPVALQSVNAVYGAKDFRRAMMGYITAGVARFNNNGDDYKVTVVSQNDTPGGTPVVAVARGGAYIRGSDNVDGQGNYFAYNDASKNITLNARPGSGSRTDIIVAHIYDATEGQAGDTWAVEKISGSTTVPASAILLATITVPSSGNITIVDGRVLAEVNNFDVNSVGNSQLVAASIATADIANGGFTSAKMFPTIVHGAPSDNVTIPDSGTLTQLCSVSFTPTVASSRALVFGVMNVVCNTTGGIEGWLKLDGVNQTGRMLVDPDNPNQVRMTCQQVWLLTGLSAASHTLQLWAWDFDATAGTDSTAYKDGTSITAIVWAG